MEFKTEYHHRSQRAEKVEAWDKFRNTTHPLPASNNDSSQPWQPFKSRADCEFASIAIDGEFTKDIVDRLLGLMRKVESGAAKVSFKNDDELRSVCDKAAEELTPIEKQTIDVPYKKTSIPVDIHKRDLWKWAKELLDNESLAPYFEWDAQKIYKRDNSSGTFTRLYDEPWTADRWWKIQTDLPEVPNAVPAPFSILLYADKTRLSSFGTVQGYPVIARCCNLLSSIRNGNGVGGARVVGWLPILKNDPEKEGKRTYTDFKRVVWHEAFRNFLSDIELYSEAGLFHHCHDGINRVLFPVILMLSADYEEQCIMSLIRGPKGKCPCPVCLIPRENLHDSQTTYEYRTPQQGRDAMATYTNVSKGAGEQELKGYGLRPGKNVFYDIKHSNPHEALSFDRLHFCHGGIFGRHLLPELQTIIKHVSSTKVGGTMGKFDDHFDRMPRWRNLNHFSSAVNTSFSDGNKFNDMSKQTLFAAQSLLTPSTSPEGYALLQLIRSYLELDCYIGFDVHTEETLRAGEAELKRFNKLLEDYIELAKKSDIPDLKLDWNFPKAHYFKHAFEDIRNKGASRNYSTHPNEGVHSLLKAAYGHTNGKNIADQILRIDQHRLAIDLLFSRIHEYEAVISAQDRSEDNDEGDEYSMFTSFPEKFHIGSPQPAATIQAIQAANPNDDALKQLPHALQDFVNFRLPNYSGMEMYREQRNWWQAINRSDTLTEFRFLKVNYESSEHWRQCTDYLRCHPSFHGHPRYDCALVQISDDEQAFVRFVIIFKIMLPGLSEPLSLALVHPYTAGLPGLEKKVDKDLGFIRVKAAPRKSAIVIPLDLIVRGAMLVPDFKSTNEFLVNTYIDGDMFLRMQKWSR
ncbi:hypothetical protein CONPUDRAFT_60954 [Coniophora puteana RWD-64-598 SS2]|uniref:Uncharacterized protein n=1 Tax=Coniophora puteana (strain RWD-64-598) TaxID=741705 RepID=A0A5M3MGZ4_CONPW|nr:uncharacterized protein CONPUDRAFT_60954 [Coniophora puteana RWD-64-598 SS2]EIW78276.1 hypothetical protein CONPUDRAFT_60954 [Coniophora puteana RWD-64-598 SS2]